MYTATLAATLAAIYIAIHLVANLGLKGRKYSRIGQLMILVLPFITRSTKKWFYRIVAIYGITRQ